MGDSIGAVANSLNSLPINRKHIFSLPLSDHTSSICNVV